MDPVYIARTKLYAPSETERKVFLEETCGFEPTTTIELFVGRKDQTGYHQAKLRMVYGGPFGLIVSAEVPEACRDFVGNYLIMQSQLRNIQLIDVPSKASTELRHTFSSVLKRERLDSGVPLLSARDLERSVEVPILLTDRSPVRHQDHGIGF